MVVLLLSMIPHWWLMRQPTQPNPKTHSSKTVGQNRVGFYEHSTYVWKEGVISFIFFVLFLWTLIIKVDYVRRSRFHSSTTSFFMALLRLLNFSDFKNLHDRVMSLMTVAVKLYIYKKRAFVLFSTGEVLIWPTFYAYSSSLSTSPK